jgi:hypothetical protein
MGERRHLSVSYCVERFAVATSDLSRVLSARGHETVAGAERFGSCPLYTIA